MEWTSRDHHPDHSRVVPPPHLVYTHRLLEPLRHELPAVRKQEALPAAEAAHRVGHEDLAAVRLRRDPRGQYHGRTEEVAVLFDGLAGVEADADAQSFESRRTSG